jgi:hypothetical protein
MAGLILTLLFAARNPTANRRLTAFTGTVELCASGCRFSHDSAKHTEQALLLLFANLSATRPQTAGGIGQTRAR